MAGILAPSNIGFKSHTISSRHQAGPMGLPYPEPGILKTNTVLLSWKSQTIKSDGFKPTQYCRMISKITSGAWEARSYDWARKAKNQGSGGTVSLLNLAHGSNFANGSVGCPSWMIDKVVADARSELNGLSANILEDLGQLQSTGAMIADIVRIMADLFLACRKGQFKYVRRALKRLGSNVPRRVANGWLMYFYGVKPLVSTIDALAAKAEPIMKTWTVRKRATLALDPRGFTTAGAWMKVAGTATQQAQCQLTAKIKLDGNTRYWANLGLTSSLWTDAAVTAWALVPYSFVFDWFIPTEQFLRNLSWSPFLEYQGGFVGKRQTADAKIEDIWPESGQPPWVGGLPLYRLQVRCYQRITYPYSVPSVNLSIRLTLNSNQIISAAALLVTRS